ncbi:MAG: hypothetical protein OXH79_20820 [Boseongicola sp.]|nr:hypothetical protein [Boseongicola sp.]
MPQVNPDLVEAIVRDAGGKVTGHTRLQKTAYLLVVAGFDARPRFAYRQDGPYSEDITMSAKMGSLVGNLKEEEQRVDWGGICSIYSLTCQPDSDGSPERRKFVQTAASAASVALELATSAVFLFREGCEDPWAETERRKPEKVSNGRLDQAKRLLAELKQIEVPTPLPDIA